MSLPEITPEFLIHGLGWWMVLVFSTCLHEAAHAFAAWRLGDPTAYHGGQVTLNPMPHIQREPLGMVIVPIAAYFLNGWMIGWASAPYDPSWARSYPRRAAWMALAGPLSNLLLLVVAGVLMRVGLATGYFGYPTGLGLTELVSAPQGGVAAGVAMILSIFFLLNLILFFFNLFPLPPLDGHAVLPLFMPERAAQRYLEFVRQPGFAFMGLLIAWSVFNKMFFPVLLWAWRLVLGV